MSKGWTIQSLIDERMSLHAYCHNPRCHHSQRIDLESVKRKLGPDTPAMAADLERKFKCSKCGGKAIGLIYAPDPQKRSGMGVSSYRKAKGE